MVAKSCITNRMVETLQIMGMFITNNDWRKPHLRNDPPYIKPKNPPVGWFSPIYIHLWYNVRPPSYKLVYKPQ